jgi:mono/diheme cytochrome c family protein
MSQKHKKKQPVPGGFAAADNRASGMLSPGPAGAAGQEEVEPQADSAAMPVWLFVLMIVLTYWGMLHLDRYAGGFSPVVFGPYESFKQVADLQPKSGAEMLVAKGEAIYGLVCIACHQATGLGSPGQYPPLVGADWVLGSPNRLIRIPLHGLTGPIQVNGQTWNAAMPAFGGAPPLDDDESLAAVLTYIRQAWGNKAPPITPEQVKAVRAETASRTAQWTADELLKLPE